MSDKAFEAVSKLNDMLQRHLDTVREQADQWQKIAMSYDLSPERANALTGQLERFRERAAVYCDTNSHFQPWMLARDIRVLPLVEKP